MTEKDINSIKNIIENTEDKRLVTILSALLGAYYSGEFDHYAKENANFAVNERARMIHERSVWDMFKFLKVRELKKKNLKVSDFTKYRGYGKSKEYYNKVTQDWYKWDLLRYVLDSEPKDCKDAEAIFLRFPVYCSIPEYPVPVSVSGRILHAEPVDSKEQKNKKNSYGSSSSRRNFSYDSSSTTIAISSSSDSGSCFSGGDGGSCGF